ncbi:transcription factor HES-5-like [Lampris incognitus]|uniref:transcription factor HES-5-like n=1 Tax=Lampris incognitus TaxID=2546036 RepID=UPI0024B4F067|nr:transcription factor HES-5-like [Lampris incognitus]
MAPTHTRDSTCSVLSSKDRHKLRKPAVEKMRRDRINSCIEQLKTLLEKEFHKQDPNAKLEKADVLEMTVVFLKQQLQPQSPAAQKAHSEGYSRCWTETLHFLSANPLKDVTFQPLQYLHAAQRAGRDVCPPSPLSPSQLHSHSLVKHAPSGSRPVWRPW